MLLSPAGLTLLVDWDQFFTVLITQSLVITPAQFFIEQDTRISHISYDLDLRLIDLILISEILCLGLRHFPCRFMLMITFDLSWADTFKFFSQTLSLTSTHFSACRSPAVGFALLCSRVLGSLLWLFCSRVLGSLPWLFCSRVLSSQPFGSCFIQPTIHPLGLKACVVHDRFIRRRSGHRTNNLLNTLTSDEPPRHDRHACGRPHTLELEGVPTIYSHSLNSSAPADSRCRDSFKIATITAAVTYFQEYSQVLHKTRTIISLVQPGYPLLCRCTESVASPQY